MDSDSIEKILNNLKIGSYLSNTLILTCSRMLSAYRK